VIYYDDERQSLFSVTLSNSEGSRLSLSHGMPRDRYFVYIMTNVSRTLYTGVTNNLVRRVYEHKNKIIPGFTSRYNITELVYFEETSDVQAALTREKEIKGWRRAKKSQLIASVNPKWLDLSSKWHEDEILR
jgi:putative endonuclease